MRSSTLTLPCLRSAHANARAVVELLISAGKRRIVLQRFVREHNNNRPSEPSHQPNGAGRDRTIFGTANADADAWAQRQAHSGPCVAPAVPGGSCLTNYIIRHELLAHLRRLFAPISLKALFRFDSIVFLRVCLSSQWALRLPQSSSAAPTGWSITQLVN